MFGQPVNQPTSDMGASSVPPMDPSVMADPSSLMDNSAPAQSPMMPPAATPPAPEPEQHQMTPAYPSVDTPVPSSLPVDDSVFQGTMPVMSADPVASDDVTTASAPAAPADDTELLAIKQDALSALTPLVGQVDQSPEDKFKTTMMMIQASDDRSLVRTAYEAAQAIPDEKARAQALLDVVNEINYFLSHTA